MKNKRCYEDITQTPSFCLMRWDAEIEQWEMFGCGNTFEELRGPISRVAWKGYDGPWVLIGFAFQEIRFKNTDEFTEWLFEEEKKM